MTIIVVGVLAVLVFGVGGVVIGTYNQLVQRRHRIEGAWKNIDVVLQQRHDELGKLIDTCKGYMKHEEGLLTKLTALRTGYSQASDAEERVDIENQLNSQLKQAGMVWENYPDLKASQNFIQIQNRIAALESTIADHRETFNDTVNVFNIQIEQFPALIVAGLLGYRKHAYLEVPAEAREDVKMEF